MQDIIVRILLDIANGLDALHKHGIVHGDLKMCNVMLVSDQSDLKGFKAKVCDAGLIPLLDLTQTHASTRHHARLTCLPPEFIKKDENSNAMDVYMFSMVMYKLWTRVRPFRGMDLSTFFHKVIEGEERPKIPEDIPQGLAKLMTSCWASDPTQR